MPVFFGGKRLVTPTIASVINDEAMRNQNVTAANNVVFIGSAGGGVPKTITRISSPTAAKTTLRSGALLEAVLKAFDPSSTVTGPSVIYIMRVDPAVQSTGTLKNGAAASVISLRSSNYGVDDNRIKVKVETGTSYGKRLTVQFDNDVYTADNIRRQMLSLAYTGSGAATVVVTGSSVELLVDAVSVASVAFATYTTIQSLVDNINTVADFTAAVLDGNGRKASTTLDIAASQSVTGTALVLSADIQAAVDWFNGSSEGVIDADRIAGVAGPLANAGFAYLSGGTNGTVTNTDWSDCLDELQTADVQWIGATTDSAVIHSMISAHVTYCTNYLYRERRAILGSASETSDTAALALAKAIGNDRVSLAHIGYYDYDVDGNLALFEPYMTACAVAAMFAGSSVGEPMTGKTINAKGLERKLVIPIDTDVLIEGGVMPIAEENGSYRVIQSISTWLDDDNYNKVEQSTGFALDYTVRAVRDAVYDLKGQKGNPLLLGRAVSIAESTLSELSKAEPVGPGVLVGNDESPAFRNITASLVGDVTRLQFECSPALPNNYTLITVYAVPFSGTATA